MNWKLTRRRFGQVAIASTAVAGLGYLANKTFAQTPSPTPDLNIYGMKPDPKSSIAGGIVLHSLDMARSRVVTQTLPQVRVRATPILQIGEQLTDLTCLADGTFVLAITPVRAGIKEGEPTRLVFLGTSPRTVTVSGLKKQDRLESLLVANGGSLLALLIKKNGRPPVDLVEIDLSTGEISLVDKIKLPQTQRFSKLAQCPNGTLYTTAVGRLGETSLVQLDLAQGKAIVRSQLKVDGTVWNSGLSDLVCSRAGQLLALGAPRYESPNLVYSVDTSNGTMTALTPFDVVKFTIAR